MYKGRYEESDSQVSKVAASCDSVRCEGKKVGLYILNKPERGISVWGQEPHSEPHSFSVQGFLRYSRTEVKETRNLFLWLPLLLGNWFWNASAYLFEPQGISLISKINTYQELNHMAGTVLRALGVLTYLSYHNSMGLGATFFSSHWNILSQVSCSRWWQNYYIIWFLVCSWPNLCHF